MPAAAAWQGPPGDASPPPRFQPPLAHCDLQLLLRSHSDLTCTTTEHEGESCKCFSTYDVQVRVLSPGGAGGPQQAGGMQAGPPWRAPSAAPPVPPPPPPPVRPPPASAAAASLVARRKERSQAVLNTQASAQLGCQLLPILSNLRYLSITRDCVKRPMEDSSAELGNRYVHRLSS